MELEDQRSTSWKRMELKPSLHDTHLMDGLTMVDMVGIVSCRFISHFRLVVIRQSETSKVRWFLHRHQLRWENDENVGNILLAKAPWFSQYRSMVCTCGGTCFQVALRDFKTSTSALLGRGTPIVGTKWCWTWTERCPVWIWINLRSSASKEITVTYSNYHETFRVDCFSDQFSTKIHPAPTKHRFTLMSQNLQGAGKTGPAKEPMVLSTIKMAGNPSLKFWCAGKPTGTSTSSSLSWMLGISAANHGCALQHLSLKAGIWVDDPPVAHGCYPLAISLGTKLGTRKPRALPYMSQ